MNKQITTAITDCWKSDSGCLFRLKVKCNNWQQPFLISRELARQNSMKNGGIQIHTAKWKTNLQTEQKFPINGA